MRACLDFSRIKLHAFPIHLGRPLSHHHSYFGYTHIYLQAKEKYRKSFYDFYLFTPATLPVLKCIDPPGQGRIGGHYFRTRCPYISPSVHHKKKQKRATAGTENKIRRTQCVKIMRTYWLGPGGSS